ncbi:MAG TPA: hypothetical protein VN756_00095 [Solirubrobacterales bacterium]|nr:hypothetical protein [Solirubrobacterales bacterium]
MSPRRATSALACLFACAALAAGCGGGSDSSTSSSATVASKPAPPKRDFPQAEGKTLGEIVKAADSHAELVVSPAALAFYQGTNRYPFGVFHPDRSQVDDAEVALYVAKVPRAKPSGGDTSKGGEGKKGAVARARTEALEAPATGPYPAAIESLATKPAFRAQTTTSDPDAATIVYTTDLDFPSDGEWRIAALIKQGDEVAATLLPSVSVGEFKGVPRVGQKAPVIHTPTVSDAGGDISEITTRIPPDTQNRVDYADALGKEPILLLFATPQFCQSRVCGPVVDVAEQVKEESGDDAAFIHMEIYNDNDPSKGVRPQVRAFNLPSEPWLFAIDRQGVIQAEVEGAFGVDSLTGVVKEVTGE